MHLPGRYRELHSVFVNAADPELSQLNGEYLVNILMIPGYAVSGHRKVFYTRDNKTYGHNVLFHKSWGRFSVEEGRAAGAGPLNVAIINYNRADNSFLVRRIRDHIRCVRTDKLYIGRAHYLLFGKMIFLGYFTLEKMDR